MPVALVTDSTASLPDDVVAEYEVHVIPLQVVIGASSYDEGPDGATPAMVAEALKGWQPVSTSRPAPAEVLDTYQRLADEGATAIVSVHLSGEISGTFESVQLAAKDAPVPVHPVDSQQVGMGTGFAVLAAARALGRGADAVEAARAAQEQVVGTTSYFYVDTLEYLRRGGRIGATGALLGSALAVKPILTITEGRVGPFERVRTSSKALARLEELAFDAAGEGTVRVAVAHLANEERAASLAERLTARLGDRLVGEVHVGEVGAVLGAHVGPGMVAVNVAVDIDGTTED